MNSFWKKTVIVAVVGMIIVLASFWVFFQTSTTHVNYWIGGSDTLSRGVVSATVHCNESGSGNVRFNLTLTLINFTAYTLVQKTVTVWNLEFMLNNGESAQKAVSFQTNAMYAFALILSFEKTPFWSTVRGNGLYPTSLAYVWSDYSGCYVQAGNSTGFL